MKKIVLLAAVISFFATSCSKDYTCTCTQTYKSDGHKTTEDHSINAKPKDSNSKCAALAKGDQGTYVESCAIK